MFQTTKRSQRFGPRAKPRPTRAAKAPWTEYEDELIVSSISDRFYVWTDEDLSRTLGRTKAEVVQRRAQLSGGV